MKQYLKLLMAREGKEVLGRKCSNLWLLTFVLVATFASIAFSEGSMIYLKDRMEDPFTNWVSINKPEDDNKFASFREALGEKECMEHYGYTEVLQDQYTNYTFQGIDVHHQFYLSCRFFEQLNTPIVHAILADDNVVDGCTVDTTLLKEKSFGLIISFDAALKLGYSASHLPIYVDYLAYSEGADTIGVELVENCFKPLSLPVLAVVRRLPNNVDIVGANYFYEQQHLNDDTHPFNFQYNEQYQHQLMYYISSEIDVKSLDNYILAQLPDSLKSSFKSLPDEDGLGTMKPWKQGLAIQYELGIDSLPRSLYQNIAQKVSEKFSKDNVQRIYKFNTKECPAQRSEFLSVSFATLDSIRAFEEFAKDEYHIQLEMEQVASKENFQAVTVIARILSAAMVIFSIVCIIMFMVNMLQSYFQKVKRNIGTFKAFGMNARELILVYVIILILIVFTAIVGALLITWGIQSVLPMLGIEKEGFNYLSLWNNTTYIATGVVMASTVITVVLVMTRMLSQTPGDLIYDRE